MRRPGAGLLAFVGEHQLGFLVALLLAAGSAWVFAELADEVTEGETQALDERLLLALRAPGDAHDPLGPAWVEELARDFTALGGVGVLAFITLAAAGFLILESKRHLALYVLEAVGGGALLSTLLKAGFDRPRPDLVPHGQVVYTSSFPSGHAMLAAVTYLTLGALLSSAVASLRVRAYILALAALLCAAVGITRVYLGVHWPTDVLAGWTAGAAWALVCWSLAEYLRRRGRLE